MRQFEEQSLALETLTGSQTSGTGARNSAMSGARVWTNSITMAAHTQPQAIANEGPFRSEELFHVLEVAMQGEASSRAKQLAQSAQHGR